MATNTPAPVTYERSLLREKARQKRMNEAGNHTQLTNRMALHQPLEQRLENMPKMEMEGVKCGETVPMATKPPEVIPQVPPPPQVAQQQSPVVMQQPPVVMQQHQVPPPPPPVQQQQLRPPLPVGQYVQPSKQY